MVEIDVDPDEGGEAPCYAHLLPDEEDDLEDDVEVEGAEDEAGPPG